MKGNSVLIVDDEAIVRESIRDWLADAGYDVATAETAEEALETIAKRDFSVMVLDIRLPGQTGLSILKEVKAQRPWIKSIIITAYPSEETTKEATRLGAIDYMVKPLAPDDLEHLIRETIESVGKEPTVITPPKAPGKPAAKAIEIKKSVVVSKQSFKSLVNNLIKITDVYGVKAKRGKYVYDSISSANELALNYDVTVLPPTAYLFPPRETILKFKLGDGSKSEPVTNNTPRAIIGVHPYDIKAIEMLDEAFITTNPDPNYIARRQNSLIIGVDNLNPSPKSFAPSMGTHTAENGFDLMLTDLGTKYMVTIGSKKGADLLRKYAQISQPTADDIAKQKAVLDEAQAKYQLHLDVPRERLPKLLEDSYDDAYWQSRSETCLSCGSCVMVCPTCFCFDVQDDVALNLKEGQRTRQWDGCMLVDFAKVATGENFRHDKASRFRHRIYRKGKYVIERYGRMGCVGCGRCAIACLAEIASPLEAFNAIAESVRAKQAAQRILREARPESELYAPRPAQLVRVEQLAAKEKVFEMKFLDGKELGHQPGQFVSVSILGIGESPFGVATSPTRTGSFEFAVRNVGSVTNAIHNLQKGAVVGIRGPFGNGFNVKALEGKDILFIAGGIGLFPVRSLIQYVMDRRKQFGRAIVLFGARTPAERLFVDELAAWKNNPDLEFYETVDRGTPDWTGNVGVITTLIPKVQIDPRKTMAIVVGPPIMYRFVIVELKKKDLPDENIIMSLERRMKCGVGKCGHCQINGVYVCQEGPVFSLAQLRNLREAV
ncbi:MAG: 4Fe-4S dicluster domain-containing protein [Dehalococcoidales bacterium]|nr:4Fe-4S dicluster domain-containing protein [Dehalococcoidales bacterium]